MARSPFIDRVVHAMRQGAEAVVQRALVDTVKTELSRVMTSAQPDTVERWIDGQAGAAIERIKADGVAYFEFSYIRTIVGFAAAQLRELSPEDFVHPDQRVFRDSHILFCDGREVGALTEGGDLSFIDRLPPRSEFVITNAQAYAGKIERGQSDQAPDGVFRLAASTVSRRYGSIVTSRFLWLRLDGLDEALGYPAIAIQAR